METPVRDPLISIILVCYKSAGWLPKCLASIQAQTIFSEIELVVVDNASGDGTEELVRNLTTDWPRTQIIQTGANLGFSANNIGAKAASGKYLYLLNPDTWLEPDCLEQFVKTMERENADAAGGTILEYEDATLQAKGSHGFDIFGNPVSPSRGRNPEPLFCIAGFFFIRRDSFERLGMLDDRYFMYGEEMDLSWRIWLSGGRLVYAPDAKCHHRGAAGVNPAGGVKVIENRTSTLKRFYANRNFLLTISKNCQHILLLMLIPCVSLIIIEGIGTLVLTRSWTITRKGSVAPFADFWRMRGHVLEQRRRIRQLRRHGDFWMLRFLRFGFGRSHEIKAALKRGFPKFNN